MTCPNCENENVKKCGKGRKGQQRWQCKDCCKKWSESRALGTCRLSIDKAEFVLSLLLEGMSVRAASRITGIDKDTILRIVEQTGKQCAEFMADAVWNLPFRDIQVDEQWAFVFCKEKTAQARGYGSDVGDCYVFTALDRDSKFLICFHCGRRDSDETWRFAHKLYCCVSGRPQITTDGFGPYRKAIPLTWRYDCDYSQIVKKYGNTPEDQRRYSPASIIGIDKKAICGNPDRRYVSTSHIERHNLTNRMHVRRLTRLTNAHSKKRENHEAMLGLYFVWYNWCRKHSTINTTPAVAAGLAQEPWTIERLLIESAKVATT